MAQVSEFQVGDVVSLKSGGPLMTVEGFDLSNISVVWFIGTGELKHTLVPEKSLKKSNAD